MSARGPQKAGGRGDADNPRREQCLLVKKKRLTAAQGGGVHKFNPPIRIQWRQDRRSLILPATLGPELRGPYYIFIITEN